MPIGQKGPFYSLPLPRQRSQAPPSLPVTRVGRFWGSNGARKQETGILSFPLLRNPQRYSSALKDPRLGGRGEQGDSWLPSSPCQEYLPPLLLFQWRVGTLWLAGATRPSPGRNVASLHFRSISAALFVSRRLPVSTRWTTDQRPLCPSPRQTHFPGEP